MPEQTTFESRATQVTFFEDRARVTRVATFPITPGRHTVRIGGVTVLIDDPSVVVRPRSAGARVLTARVHRVLRSVPAASGAEIERLEEERRHRWRELELHRRELARNSSARRRVATLEQALLAAMQPVPDGLGDTASWADALERITAELDLLEERYAAVVDAVASARRAEARATLLLDQARAEHPEIDAALEVELEADEEAQLTVEFEYFTPCALWRPSHVARLSAARDAIDLRMFGTVWQQTGERWEDIRCRFSTARPTQAAAAPLVTDDWLRARPKTDEERQSVQVEARDVDIANTGTELGGQVEAMPGVDDGGEPLTLDAAEPVTIPSNGEPFRVEVLAVQAACKADIVAFPERSTVPYVRARGTWSHDIPILAGPVVVMRGNEYVGRSRIDFVASGETFELGFGVDSGVSVHRTLDDEHKTTAVTGKNVLHRTVKVYLSNLSDRPRHLTVVERIPVSEIEEVSVKKVDASVTPDADGFVEFAVELAPHAVATEKLAYRVEYGSKVRLSW